MSQLVSLPLEERHTHDCKHCMYRGSTYGFSKEGPVHYDWYICPPGKQTSGDMVDQHASLIKRHGPEGSEYTSAALWGSSVEFDFIREATRLGILKLSPTDPETLSMLTVYKEDALKGKVDA